MGLIAKISKLARAVKNRVMGVRNGSDIANLIQQSTVDGRHHQWLQMYQNRPEWLSKTIVGMNLAATVAAEVSRLVTLEMASVVDDSEVDAIYQREIISRIRGHVECGLALGGIIFKPYTRGDAIRIDIAQPSDYTILNAETNGTVTEIVFKDYREHGGKWYVRLEHHAYSEDTLGYAIENKVYASDKHGTIGNEIADYSQIGPWAEILPLFELQNIKAPLFGYFKPALSDNEDTKSPAGVSIYSRAVEAIKRADTQLSALLREFRVKEAKQYVSSLMVKNPDAPLPYLQDEYYIRLNTGGGKTGNEEFFESYSPQIYVREYLEGLNEYKRQVEDCIGLAHGTISKVDDIARTATEIMMSKQRTYVLVSENQRNLRAALENTVYAIGVWLKYPSAPPDYTVTTDFDDSMITDWEGEVKGMLQDVEAGLLRPEVYLMKKYGVTEEEARKMMPEGERLLASEGA